MMSVHERCGQGSPARYVCRVPPIARHLWDLASSHPLTFVLSLSVYDALSIPRGSRALQFGVSPATLGVVGDVIDRFGPRPMVDGRRCFAKCNREIIDVVTNKVCKVFGAQKADIGDCSINSKWILVGGCVTGKWVLALERVENLGESLRLDIPIDAASSFPNMSWLGFNSSNPEQAVAVRALKRGYDGVTFLIQVISLQPTLETRQASVVSTTKLNIDRYNTSPFLSSVLCMRRQNGTAVFILTLRIDWGDEVHIVDEFAGHSTCLSQADLPSLSQQDNSIFLICSSSPPPSFHAEFWDCNNTTKPLRVIEQNGVSQWFAESGFFFKVNDLPTPESGKRQKCILVEEAASGKRVLSFQFPADADFTMTRLFSFPGHH
ncbi:hypothetical protein Pelo_18342 [Pelomyxa schiedti]|nr:hypothetical protein Pelo_18342 [Pelomyxa schiedti]